MIIELTKDEIFEHLSFLRQNFNSINYPIDVITKFWERVNFPENYELNLDKCWEWNSTRDKDGYGMFSNVFFGSTPYRAHRFSYEIFYGEIETNNVICHNCDNPSCVNPFHLKSDSHQNNMEDCRNRNRHVYGSKVGNSKIKEKDIEDIINLKYISRNQIIKTLGISQIQIDYIFGRQVWRSVTDKYSDEDLIKARNFINSKSSLTFEQVKDIKERLKNGEKQISIAKSYNISKGIIGDISRGKNYKNI